MLPIRDIVIPLILHWQYYVSIIYNISDNRKISQQTYSHKPPPVVINKMLSNICKGIAPMNEQELYHTGQWFYSKSLYSHE